MSSSSGKAFDLEALLRQALTPIEPPLDLERKLQEGFASLLDRAADELESWELSSMHDPRNWIRPIGAAVIGSAAVIAFILVRRSHQKHSHSSGWLRRRS
jgi:hypothetical protein